MAILLSEDDFWKNLNEEIFQGPLIFVGGASCLYLLIKGIDSKLEDYIYGGKTDASEFHVFAEEQEWAMIRRWERDGLRAAYHRQQIDYMNWKATVTYLRVCDPATGTSISLIPWFMLPGRPYPVFAYVYAIWHYQSTGEKSLSLSAAAAGKLFGIGGLNKSTVSRNIKAMGDFIDLSHIDRPLATGACGSQSDEEMIGRIPEILRCSPPNESLEEIYGEMAKRLPAPINSKEAAKLALSGIPVEYSQIMKCGGNDPDNGKLRECRKRPARPRKKGTRRVQRPLRFASPHQIEKARIAFIGICQALVLDAAATYRRFLI